MLAWEVADVCVVVSGVELNARCSLSNRAWMSPEIFEMASMDHVKS